MIDPRDPALNYVVVSGGVRSPGRARITGVAAPFNWDIQTGYALSGAFTIYKGPGIAKPLLSLDFWLVEHFQQWEAFKTAIRPPTKARPQNIEMQHPVLAAAGIKAVQVEEIGEPERQGNGLWTASVKLIEFRPPLPALVKPKGSIPAVDKAPPVTPETAGQKFVAEAQKAMEEARARANK